MTAALIAESRWSSCHALGLDGQSPNPAVPPMPVFQFDPKGADALIAYLKSTQVGKYGIGRNPM
jgi:hypothetical protein